MLREEALNLLALHGVFLRVDRSSFRMTMALYSARMAVTEGREGGAIVSAAWMATEEGAIT
jgi:hypothetical protein